MSTPLQKLERKENLIFLEPTEVELSIRISKATLDHQNNQFIRTLRLRLTKI